MKKYIYIASMALMLSTSVMAEDVSGVVKDAQGTPLVGAKVALVGNPSISCITDDQGFFELNLAKGDWVEISYADVIGKRVKITGTTANVIIQPQDKVIQTGMTSTLGAEQTQAISTVFADELSKNSSPNPYNTLYGLLAGLGVNQQTGWMDNPTLVVRGRGSLNGSGPLIVVDGFPRALEYLNTSEIESVSVLKDGAATAVWGPRGANGVVLITTKRGTYNKMDIDVNYQFGMGFPVNQPKFADGYTYAMAKNEALVNDGLPQQYLESDLNAFKNGTNRDVYANTDWLKEGLRDRSFNNQAEFIFRGGGKWLRYYTSLNYKNDYGILNSNYTDYSERYNSQMKKYNLNLRMNLDIDVTPYTTAKLTMLGMLYERKRPNTDEATLFGNLFKTPSAAFPVKTSHGIWGGNTVYKDNPIARIADVGYYKEDQRMLQSDLRIIQDFSMITPGLRAELAVSYDNSATYRETGKKDFMYEANTPVLNPGTGLYEIVTTQFGANSALEINNEGLADQFIRANLEAKVAYDRYFGKHAIAVTGLYRQESLTPTGAKKARYRQYITGTASYGYDSKYLLDVVVNHSGTSVAPEGARFRTYPAVSAAWVVSNEAFMKSVSAINNLKLRASWGKSGYDSFDYYMDRQYWTGSNTGQFFYDDNSNAEYGLREGTLALKDMSCEVSDKFNVGIDLMLLNKLTLTADWFLDKRRSILVDGSKMFSSVLGATMPKVFNGAVDTKGVDLALNWQESKKDFKYNIGATFSYAKSNVKENGEGYQPYSYLSAKGYPIGQMFGLEAIGYFRDEADIAKSPVQTYSDVRPGDIKYKDQNNDKKIDQNDRIAIGKSSSFPDIYYGINLGFEYKGFGVDMLFQGAAGYSKMLNTASVYWPLRNNTNISMWYLEDKIRWTEQTKDIANVPRLTTLNSANNFQNSTQWLVDGSFFKLRNLNVYYNLPQQWVKKMKMEKFQVFARGNNLFSLDHVKYMNCEDFGVGYPDMLSVYMGVSVNF